MDEKQPRTFESQPENLADSEWPAAAAHGVLELTLEAFDIPRD